MNRDELREGGLEDLECHHYRDHHHRGCYHGGYCHGESEVNAIIVSLSR